MWFQYLLWSTYAVGLGLVFEGPELWHEIRHILLERRDRRMFFRTTPHEISPRWKMLAFAGWVLIVLGVIGEGIFEGLVSRVDGQVQTFNSTLLGAAQREAADAVLVAALANERTAKLENENLKLKAIIAWRVITPQQVRELRRRLNNISFKIEVLYPFSDPEADHFAHLLGNALPKPLRSGGIGGRNAIADLKQGLSVAFTLNAGLDADAEKLRKVLEGVRLARNVSKQQSLDEGKHLQILVGPRL